MADILQGIRVLEWSAIHIGPVAASMLGDLGAEVIKVEERTGGDIIRGTLKARGIPMTTPSGRNLMFEGFNRSKKSIALDLKKEQGREILYRLVKQSDVFLTNFRQAAAVKLGADYQTLRQINPRLIYAQASAFGSRGPDAGNPGMDPVTQARSGIMLSERDDDALPFSPGGLGDQIGSVYLAYGVIAALLGRERLGIGQEVRTSALGGLLSLQTTNLTLKLLTRREPKVEDRKKVINPLHNLYRCGDGKWLRLGMALAQDRYWPRVCHALGLEELEQDPRFNNMDTREQNRELLISIMDRIFAQRPRPEWLKKCQEFDLLAAPVNSLSAVLTDPQVVENQYIVDYPHPVLGMVKYVGFPVEFTQTPASIRSVAPELGQHTEEVLLGVGGYSWEDIQRLREAEVI